MRLITLLPLILMLSSCGKSEPKSGAPKPPTASDPGEKPSDTPDAMGAGDPMTVSGADVKENPKVRALTPSDEINCSTMCGQLAFCNQKIYQKNTSGAALSTCVKGCTARRGETDKGRWEAMETCMKQHGGEDCVQLRACIEASIAEIQKRLQGMDPPPPPKSGPSLIDPPAEVKP